MGTLEELIDDFELLDDWEERYRHVIELGRELPSLPADAYTPASKVRGCASQVWIRSRTEAGARGPVLYFEGDSDALIVKGLIAIAFMIYSGKPASDILATDAGKILGGLGLREHLTQQRSNGFAAMIQRIKTDARDALQSEAAIAGR